MRPTIMGRTPDPPEVIHTSYIVNQYRTEACCDCAVYKRSGGLPCHWRSELDILGMNIDCPSFMITSCPHYKWIEDPSDLIDWV